MKNFVQLNTVSVLYALALFISIELMINVYRVSRVTGWDLGIVIIIIPVIILIGLITSTVLIISMIKKWKIGRRISYCTVFMWFPYFIFFHGISTYLFPLNSGETWLPIFNLLIYGVILLYPIYILIVNFYATSINKGNVKVTGILEDNNLP